MDLSQRPSDNECFDFHRDYVAKVPDGNILDTLQAQLESAPKFIRKIPMGQFEVIHAPYEWRVRTVLEHCCDAERVFGYRILRFATGDPTNLPGWDENHYAACGYGDAQNTDQIASEFAAIRQSNLALVRRIAPENWEQSGLADNRKMSVRTIAWLMAGHWLHHQHILMERLGEF